MTMVYTPGLAIPAPPPVAPCRRRAVWRRKLANGGRVPDVVALDDLIRALGFDRPEAARAARDVLERGGLTRAGKRAIAVGKLPEVERVLAASLVRVCGEECLRIDRQGAHEAREAVSVWRRSCEICGGSNNVRATIQCARVLDRKRVRRVVVVGGTGVQQHQLAGLLSAVNIELRFVDGTRTSHSAKDALANTRWAQLVVVWAPTPLRHAVSDLYTERLQPGVRLVVVNRRGIEALCAEIVRSYT